MYERTGCPASAAPRIWSGIWKVLLAGALTVATVAATEGGASVYPAGAETAMPGTTPADRQTTLYEFTNSYEANSVVDSAGHSLVPGFHLRVEAVAGRIAHNWNVHLLGGSLVSSVAVPLLYMHLDGPFGKGNKTGFGNPDIDVASIAYNRGALHFWYGLDVFTPGFGYHKNDLVNIGQHNWSLAPEGAFTYLPNKGEYEISSKFQYIVNYTNPDTNYRSGNEFLWEYDAMRKITKMVAVGGNGFFYQQTTDDQVNGSTFLDGNRGRDFSFGPEVRFHFRDFGMAAKFQRDLIVENKTVGNSFWLQFAIPLGNREK